MDTYTILRQFADSWMLLGMTLAFLGVVLWTFRPGAARLHRESAEIPLRDDRQPLRGDAGAAGPGSTER